MKLLKYEVKKLVFNKYIVVFFVILLCINIALIVFASNDKLNKTDIDKILDIFQQYEENPEVVEKEYNYLVKLKDEYLKEEIRTGDLNSDKNISKNAFSDYFFFVNYSHGKNISTIIKIS